MNELTDTKNQLRVWWIPQVPLDDGENPFFVKVKTLEEAALIIDALGDYDFYQFHHNIKGDFSNAGGLEVLVDGEWVDWEDEDGNSFDEWLRDQETD